MLKLYDYPDCPFCQKVRVVLAEKDLEYEKIFVDLRKQEQKLPDFLRLNPYGKVPVLVDQDAEIASAYGVLKENGGIARATYLIDPDGKIAYAATGAHGAAEVLGALRG